jgi:hypothetical protein
MDDISERTASPESASVSRRFGLLSPRGSHRSSLPAHETLERRGVADKSIGLDQGRIMRPHQPQ